MKVVLQGSDSKSIPNSDSDLTELLVNALTVFSILTFFGTALFVALTYLYHPTEILLHADVENSEIHNVAKYLQPIEHEAQSLNDPTYNEILSQGLNFNKELKNISHASILTFNPVNQNVYIRSNSAEKRSIASITKLMSALVAESYFKPEDLIVVPDIANYNFYSQLGVSENDTLSYEDALQAMLVGSYNDSAYIIADNYPGGYEAFIGEMNETALRLGMDSSSFSNPAGFDDSGNYSTAEDLKKLLQKVLQNERLMEIVNQSVIKVTVYNNDGIRRSFLVESTNRLLSEDSSVIGLKTGYTDTARRSLISYYYDEGKTPIINILLGAEVDRFEESAKIADIFGY